MVAPELPHAALAIPLPAKKELAFLTAPIREKLRATAAAAGYARGSRLAVRLFGVNAAFASASQLKLAPRSRPVNTGQP
jgi:hypothetical protein